MHYILTLFTWSSGNPAVSYELLGPVTDGQSVEGTYIIFLVHQLLIKQELLKCYVVITLLFNEEHFSSSKEKKD